LSSKACYAGEVFPPYFTRVSATAAADAQGFEQAIDPSRKAPIFLYFDSPLRDCLWVARLPLAPTAHLVGKVFACCCSCLILGVRNTVEATAVLVDAHCNVCRHYGAKPALLNSMQQKMPQRWRLDSLAESCEKLFVSCVCGTPTSRDYAKEVAEYGSNNQKS
jgi:hypothetical protein